MTGTETFAVLSTEDLDQVLGGGMGSGWYELDLAVRLQYGDRFENFTWSCD